MRKRSPVLLAVALAVTAILLAGVAPGLCEEPSPPRQGKVSVGAGTSAGGGVGVAYEGHIRGSLGMAGGGGGAMMGLGVGTPGGPSSSMGG
ncbi:MAG TPA: hypothetical protein DDW96_04165, partial [Synergistaceae bacterium]|nr:hypothetical protein [Synergistaceae bacterium]